MEILKPVRDLSLYPPGINTYFFETIGAEVFSWHVNGWGAAWVSYVKVPGMAFFLADADLFPVPGLLDAYRLGPGGTLNTADHHGMLMVMQRETAIRYSLEIQANYAAIPHRQLQKSVARIEAERDKKRFRGHQSWLLDMALMQQALAANDTD